MSKTWWRKYYLQCADRYRAVAAQYRESAAALVQDLDFAGFCLWRAEVNEAYAVEAEQQANGCA